MVSRKLGNINISVFVIIAIFIILILFAFCINYVQLTSTIMNIKNDLYNIAQNGIIANNKEDLALNSYKADETRMKGYIQNVLSKNYIRDNGYIKRIIIEECNAILDKENVVKHTNGRYDETIIHLKIGIVFKPIIKMKGIYNEIYVNIHEDVKSTLLQYGGK